MMQVFEIFWTFFLIGVVSFGGGFAMIPVIEVEVLKHGWMNTTQYTDIIAVGSMSPGPIATNSAVLVGYQVGGLLGAIVAGIGIIIPSFILVIITATYFTRLNKHRLVKSAFYGLRPIITGLIFYTAIRFAITNNMVGKVSWNSLSMICIFLLSLFCLLKLRLHPVLVIVFSGLLGIVLYS